MNEETLVSVIMPAYNAEATIRASIENALSQTYSNVEVIVADDGSADRTAALVEEIAARDTRVRLVRLAANSGRPAVARNRAMEQARGAFFAFLDSDDLWEREKIARQVDYLHQHPEADGVCCWVIPFRDGESTTPNAFVMRTDPICSRAELLTGMPFFTSSLMLRRRCYDECGGMDEDERLRNGEDAEYFVRLLARFTIHRIPEGLARYRLSSRTKPSMSRYEADDVNSKGWRLQQVLEEKGVLTPEELRRRRAFLWYETARWNLHEGRPFRRPLFKAILAGYRHWKVLLTCALSFLPGPLLSRLLTTLQDAANRRKL